MGTLKAFVRLSNQPRISRASDFCLLQKLPFIDKHMEPRLFKFDFLYSLLGFAIRVMTAWMTMVFPLSKPAGRWTWKQIGFKMRILVNYWFFTLYNFRTYAFERPLRLLVANWVGLIVNISNINAPGGIGLSRWAYAASIQLASM